MAPNVDGKNAARAPMRPPANCATPLSAPIPSTPSVSSAFLPNYSPFDHPPAQCGLFSLSLSLSPMSTERLTNLKFAAKMADILSELMVCDCLIQDQLFETQDAIADLVCDGLNQNLGIAHIFHKKWPHMFMEVSENVDA